MIAVAASGEPTTFLTLTVNPAVGEGPLNRRNMLHDAWKRLVKRILRQFALEPLKRWALKLKDRAARMAGIVRSITKKTKRLEVTRLPYMAFLERTEQGEPHLHILLRAPYIPQDWLSEQMHELIGAPIVDIRQVKSTRAAVFYVTKYVTKAPAQFGATKRYWISRGWEVNAPEKTEKDTANRSGIRVRLMKYAEWREQLDIQRHVIVLKPDGWIAIYPNGTAWDQWGNFREPADA